MNGVEVMAVFLVAAWVAWFFATAQYTEVVDVPPADDDDDLALDPPVECPPPPLRAPKFLMRGVIEDTYGEDEETEEM